MGASRLVLRRLVWSVPLLVGIAVVVFAILLVLPGNPADLIQGNMVNPELTKALVQKWGLDQPVPVRFGRWAWSVLRFDFGTSLATGRPVIEMLVPAAAYSALLGTAGIVIGLAVGLPAGILSAVRQHTKLDAFVTLGALMGLTLPPFVLALLLQIIFGFYLRILPLSGAAPSIFDVKNISFLVLPAFTVGIYQAAINARVVRVSMLDVLQADYIRTAKGKGLTEIAVLIRHALPNVLVPLVTLIAVYVRSIISGLLLVEIVFSWPGIGRLFFDAVLLRDYPVIQAVALLIAVIIYAINLLVDLLYAYLDPRIRVEGAAA